MRSRMYSAEPAEYIILIVRVIARYFLCNTIGLKIPVRRYLHLIRLNALLGKFDDPAS